MPQLRRHPDSRSGAIAIEAQAERQSEGRLAVSFIVRGDLAALILPPTAPSARADDLWRRTCFEAFVRAEGEDGYYEFNLAPSTEWAVYRFDGYRQGMAPAGEAPRIEVRPGADAFELRAVLDLGELMAPSAAWRVGLSAVVEDAGGVSYWALAHPAGKPDFHHPDCFALELPATGRP